MSRSFSPTTESASGAMACGVAQAEHDYYDCLARFGHESAEAHVAERLWRMARSGKAQSNERTA